MERSVEFGPFYQHTSSQLLGIRRSMERDLSGSGENDGVPLCATLLVSCTTPPSAFIRQISEPLLQAPQRFFGERSVCEPPCIDCRLGDGRTHGRPQGRERRLRQFFDGIASDKTLLDG